MKRAVGRANKRVNRKHKTSQRTLTAWEMYLKDFSQKEIGVKLGLSQGRVSQLLNEEFQAIREDTNKLRERYIAKEIERMREYIAANFELAKDHPRVADTLLAYLERNDKLHGLSSTKKLELSGPGGGPIQQQTATIDMTKYSVEQLKALEALLSIGQLPPDAPVAEQPAALPAPLPMTGTDG